jgi:hypothetical protein
LTKHHRRIYASEELDLFKNAVTAFYGVTAEQSVDEKQGRSAFQTSRRAVMESTLVARQAGT